MRLVATCLLAFAALAGGQAAAQTVGDAPPGDAPRNGPALRLRAGPAYLSSTMGFGESPDRHYAGAGFAFDAEIGGWLSSKVSLCLELSGALVLPASAGDSATLASGGSTTADLSTAGIGPSITYTFNPTNVYLAANPAFTILRTSAPDHFFLAKNWGSNHFGLGVGFVVGAAWQVSAGWRLGLAGEARYAAVSGVGDISTMSEYALFFSAAYD